MSETDTGPALPAMAVACDPWADLRRHTPARIALGRTGTSLPTAEVLRFAAAHAQARDAVHEALDVRTLAADLHAQGFASVVLGSRAATRDEYLRRPDRGRRLDDRSAQVLAGENGSRPRRPGPVAAAPDLAVVLADGLSARAAQQHAVPTLAALRDALRASPISLSPVLIATQARVALADEAGALLGAAAVLILLGERPGLSSPDSLGAYLTFAPRVGRSDAERNCVSNIRPAGLAPAAAAARLAWLVQEALRRRLTGVGLKDDSATLILGRESAGHGAGLPAPC